VAAMHGAGTLPQLTVPRFHQGYLVPIESLPDTFQADLAAFCRHLAGADPLAENGPPRPLRPISVYRRRFQVLQLASGLITRGRPAETMRTLADLVMPDTLREALLFFLDRSGGRTTTQISQLAYTALMIAKHWASADAATIAAIRKLNSRVACDNRGMTEKNAGRLRQFEDPENLRRLLLLPEELFAELRHRGDRSRAACVQARSALAVAILLAAPIRLGNLVALRLGIHLLLRGDKQDGSRMVGLLALAYDRACEAELAMELAEILAAGQLPDLAELRGRFMPSSMAVPIVTVTLPAAVAYDALFSAPQEWLRS
jgi:hypothetical protein